MNLRAIANRATQRVNPNVSAVIKRSLEPTVSPSGKRTPTYQDLPVRVQVQPASTGDIQKLEALNIQGVHRVIYISAEVEAMIRVDKKGGDQIVFEAGVMPEDDQGTRWIISAVLEVWGHDWRKCAITLQNSYTA